MGVIVPRVVVPGVVVLILNKEIHLFSAPSKHIRFSMQKGARSRTDITYSAWRVWRALCHMTEVLKEVWAIIGWPRRGHVTGVISASQVAALCGQVNLPC